MWAKWWVIVRLCVSQSCRPPSTQTVTISQNFKIYYKFLKNISLTISYSLWTPTWKWTLPEVKNKFGLEFEQTFVWTVRSPNLAILIGGIDLCLKNIAHENTWANSQVRINRSPSKFLEFVNFTIFMLNLM